MTVSDSLPEPKAYRAQAKTHPDPKAYREKFVERQLSSILESIDKQHAAEPGSLDHIEPNAVTECALSFNGSFDFTLTGQSDLWKRFAAAMKERGFSNLEIRFRSDDERYTRFTYELATDV